MSSVKFTDIEPLIVSQEPNGSTISVTFRCPESGLEVMGRGRLQKSQDLQSVAERSAKKNLWGGLRRSVTRAVSSTMGNGMVGKFARDVAGGALSSVGPSSAHSAAEIQAGILEAFETVRAKFRWDVVDARWVGILPAQAK